uniref:Histidine-rich glycoprotein n=1 Tax=Glossina morsitans morsitans TaxID=37546 RepID=A0A1B0FFY1_GLOMM
MESIEVLCAFVIVVSTLEIHDLGHYGGHEQHEHVEYVHHESAPQHEETDLHHHVEHKHATSHQSVKFHHYHPVPVYIKKDDQHLVKKPVEIGGTKQKLKQIHPETEKNYNHGAVLEEHSESKFHHYGEPHYEHYHHHHE